MSDYDHTHDGPSGRWRPSNLIKISKADVCYGPDCPGKYPRRAIQGGGRQMSITALTPITAGLGPYASIITTVRGGTGPYTYYINTGSLPPGLSINLNTANISGTLTVPSIGTYSFTILVIDSTGRKAISNQVMFTVTATLWDLATWNQSNWS